MTPVLETKSLHRTFGAVTAARDVNVVIVPGEVVGVIGANGAGKTTFVNLVTGYVKPTAGAILFQGRDITALGPRATTEAGIARSFQIPQLFHSATVFENLMIALGVAESGRLPLWRALATRTRTARCEQILARFQIADYRTQTIATLSQGVRKLLDIAMALVHEPRLVLLDEPTSGITAAEKYGLMDVVIGALREEQVTVLFIEHDMDIVARYAKRVLAFHDGTILADGATEATLADEQVRRCVIGEELHRSRERPHVAT